MLFRLVIARRMFAFFRESGMSVPAAARKAWKVTA
jgi:hypothetical protein